MDGLGECDNECIRWQRRIQGEMAIAGYNETKVRVLIRTNWIRTISYLLLALLCISILLRVLPGTT